MMGTVVAAAVALVGLATASKAFAESEFTATGGAGTVEVKAAHGWHINKEAPWKVTVGTTSIGKDKWALSADSAKVTGVPAGEAKVKVYVCSGDACKNAEVTVKVQ